MFETKKMAKACAFVADLPEDMSTDALERLYAWGKSSCENFDVHMNPTGSMTLVVVRKKPGTARDHQRNLRTLLQNWGVALPQRQSGWLRIISEEDISNMEQAPATSVHQSDEDSGPAVDDKADRPTAPAAMPAPATSTRQTMFLPPTAVEPPHIRGSSSSILDSWGVPRLLVCLFQNYPWLA